MDRFQFFGMLAGVMSLVAYVPYIYSIVARKTNPSRATWFILSVVVVVTLVTYRSAGAEDSIWVVIGDLVGVLTIALLSIRYGVGGRKPLDVICFSGAFLALFAWWISGVAVVGLVTILTIDIMAIVPTIVKTYKNGDEDGLAWGLTTASDLINFFSISTPSFGILAYPVYHVTSSGAVLLLIVWSDRRCRARLLRKE